MKRKHLIANALDDEKLLQELIPGKHPLIEQVRYKIVQFAKNISAKGAILIGPVGSGKSTIARIMAFMRNLHLCTDNKRSQLVENLKFDGPFRIDKQLLDFYEEINLTGLIPSLAQAQLFGVAKGAYTGALERPGIFEQAMTGHSSMDKQTTGAKMTGGVVLLDEIGDLPGELQPLLLSVLTGVEVFRTGGEGNIDYQYKFTGAAIAATWKNIFDGLIRPDLLSRLSNYVIELPSLNDRKAELEEIVSFVIQDMQSQHKKELDRLFSISSDYISRPKINELKKRQFSIEKRDINALQRIDWTKLGDLRGLRQILERCFYGGISVIEALGQQTSYDNKQISSLSNVAETIIDLLLQSDGIESVSEAIRDVERDVRKEFSYKIKADHSVLIKVAKKFNISENTLKRKLDDLTRNRSKKVK